MGDDMKEIYKAGLDHGCFRSKKQFINWFEHCHKNKSSKEESSWLFDLFDHDSDSHLNEKELLEFIEHWVRPLTITRSALVVVDYQNDFISGNLSVEKAEDVVRPINRLIEFGNFDLIVYTIDWHPENHISFFDNAHLRKISSDPSQIQPFSTVQFDEPKIEQTLWPRHCVQGTWGSELHKDLLVTKDSVKVYKGTNPDIDSYSAFYDNNNQFKTSLDDCLRENLITDVYICGLAYEVCVAATSEDALTLGYKTAFVEDCSKGLDSGNMSKAKQKLQDLGAVFANSYEVARLLSSADIPHAWAKFVAQRYEKKRKELAI